MLEVLLFQYKDQFQADFPLANYAGVAEIDLINLLYYCVFNGVEVSEVESKEIPNYFPDAPKA